LRGFFFKYNGISTEQSWCGTKVSHINIANV